MEMRQVWCSNSLYFGRDYRCGIWRRQKCPFWQIVGKNTVHSPTIGPIRDIIWDARVRYPRDTTHFISAVIDFDLLGLEQQATDLR